MPPCLNLLEFLRKQVLEEEVHLGLGSGVRHPWVQPQPYLSVAVSLVVQPAL